MTNISKRKVKKNIYHRIEDQFISTLINIRKPKQAHEFVEDFLTSSEKIMFYKRLTIIFMLANDISQYSISKNLKVSRDTTSRIAKIMDRGGYEYFLKEINKIKDKNLFQAELEFWLRMGMPPIVGKGRWKNFSKYHKGR